MKKKEKLRMRVKRREGYNGFAKGAKAAMRKEAIKGDSRQKGRHNTENKSVIKGERRIKDKMNMAQSSCQ